MTKYILFVAECANFCPRTALIPKDEFVKARKEEYELLKQCGLTSTPNFYVLFKNIVWSDGVGTSENTEWGHIVDLITLYCEADDRENWGNKKDRKWIDGMITDLSPRNFNAIKITKELLSKQNIECFQILELYNGKRRNIPYDTVDEMLAHYF